jgi:hypothetical protein
LFKLIRSVPDTLRYEHQLIVPEGDYVIVYGRSPGILEGQEPFGPSLRRNPLEIVE